MKKLTRRAFVKQVGAAAAVTAGAVNLNPRAYGANERVTLALVGGNNRGWQIAKPAIDEGAVFKSYCDIDQGLLAKKGDMIQNAQKRDVIRTMDYDEILNDKDIDGVMIATPDHWHAIQTIRACQAGKDVFIEKPLSHTIEEGRLMQVAARKYGRVVQVGTQRRSLEIFRNAVEYAASGKLGKICMMKGWSTTLQRKSVGRPPDSEPPEGVDYDRWLGPAPERPFNKNRFHYTWRFYWDYGTAEMGNMGVHALDICLWAVAKMHGLERCLPDRVSCVAGKYWLDDDKEIPDSQVVTYDYKDFMMVWELMCFQTGHRPHGSGHGAVFYGTEGTLVAHSGELTRPDGSVEQAVQGSGGSHTLDFMNCIKSREKPSADIEIGRLSTEVCLLGNIAHHLGRDVHFDPKTGTFGDDREANALLTKEYRAPYTLPKI